MRRVKHLAYKISLGDLWIHLNLHNFVFRGWRGPTVVLSVCSVAVAAGDAVKLRRLHLRPAARCLKEGKERRWQPARGRKRRGQVLFDSRTKEMRSLLSGGAGNMEKQVVEDSALSKLLYWHLAAEELRGWRVLRL